MLKLKYAGGRGESDDKRQTFLMRVGIVPCQHTVRHGAEQMINLVSRVQEREVQKNAPYEKRRLNHVFRHVAIMGGQSDVAGDDEEEVRRYDETEAGFLLYLLRAEFQLFANCPCERFVIATCCVLHVLR